MAALGEQGFDICLQAGATTWVVAGETEDNGARAVDIHGRELTTKPFGGSSALARFADTGVFMAVCCSSAVANVSRVLEPLKKFQWCLMASSGYARVDPNNNRYRRYYVVSKGMGAS
jgi:hypothetical protein